MTNDQRDLGKLEAKVEGLKREMHELKEGFDGLSDSSLVVLDRLSKVEQKLDHYQKTLESVDKALASLQNLVRFAQWLAGILGTLVAIKLAWTELRWWK